jgi:hypothetical protein
MLFELIGTLFFGAFTWLMSLLPPISVQLPDGAVGALSNILMGVGYFFPVELYVTLIIALFLLRNGLLIWRIFLRIVKFIPGIG